ncbi:50S ribosomal protein L7ae-like protein [Thalassorhabdus alkalitolerans]|uniref:RNA-binding protein ACFPU1_13515 n=1 Tax=Thalassorhabdus alkalitolerans TaxID=2282697 RepID=A0ABW0YQT8_9BACI|nr:MULTISPECIES: 50S ribosomal protein L7ae-like protein [Bacillaceae]
MSYEKVTQAAEVVIGTKQTLKALEAGTADEVIVAEDAEKRVVNKIILAAKDRNIPIHTVDSMQLLGKACGIDVGAATVALKKG